MWIYATGKFARAEAQGGGQLRKHSERGSSGRGSVDRRHKRRHMIHAMGLVSGESAKDYKRPVFEDPFLLQRPYTLIYRELVFS